MRLCKTLSTLAGSAWAMPVRRCAALSFLLALSLSPASAGMFENAPDAIVCPFKAMVERPGGLVVFYVDARAEDGRIFYRPLGKLAIQLSVDANGVIKSENIAGCHGKTVRQLRDAGRAFDFR